MSVPFFSDFTKRTKDFFKRDKYDLGQVVEVSTKCGDSISVKTKVSHADSVKTKFTATVKRPNGRQIEVTEDLRKGLSLKLKLPKFYRNIDIETEHTNADVELTAKYKPAADAKNAFYSTKVTGYYNPDRDGARVCKTKAEFAVGDDQLNLSVGGDITVVDKSKHDAHTGAEPKVTAYTLGFLYTPTKDSQYSIIYTPDPQSNGMEYSFTCFRKMSDKCQLAAKADGKVDTKLTGFPPVVTLAGGWTLGANYMQGFVNSRKEYGLAYKVKVSDSATLNLGLSSYLSDEQRMETRFGYKLQV
eukprot:CAMPEP_0197024560 /NCGR_PEP_ID=MMETSP1384-20130603/5075_1 /TAXON_ID=29189 /ORGANISM="Ammonia sp." /LENGTH=300 /DNA_ID=CAMNT_0042452961 /DNA_START=62 /DNA_END=964 /DNA_ORIENTATION=+